jgi:hypothetical protein
VTTRRTYAALLAVAALAAGCGSDDEGGKPIPSAQVSALDNQLDSIQSRFEEGGGACNDILRGDDTNLDAVQAQLDRIPKSVDADVRRALGDSFQRLFDLVSSQCDTSKGQETTPETTESTPTQPETTESTPTQPETQQTQPQTQTTQEPPGQAKPKNPKPPKGGGEDGGAQSPSP